jgi:hypothetical protein
VGDGRPRGWQVCPNDPPCPHNQLAHSGDGVAVPFVCEAERCTCGRPVDWLTPARRDQLRRGGCPVNGIERRYQDGIFAHRAERAVAEDRRG